MNLKGIEQLIEENIELIAVDAKGLAEAKDRAGRFLIACALLTTYLKDLETQMAKTKTAEEGTHAQAISEIPGNKITEKKAQAVLNPAYIQARELQETLEAQRSWLRGYIKIFENAHLMYRQYSRES